MITYADFNRQRSHFVVDSRVESSYSDCAVRIQPENILDFFDAPVVVANEHGRAERFSMSEEKLDFSVRANVHVRAAQLPDFGADFHVRAVRHAQTVRVEPRDVVVDVAHVDLDLTRSDLVAAAAQRANCDFVHVVFFPFEEFKTGLIQTLKLFSER